MVGHAEKAGAYVGVRRLTPKPVARVTAPVDLPRPHRPGIGTPRDAGAPTKVTPPTFDVRWQEEWVEGVQENAGAGPLRQLKRGKQAIAASLDLHGLTSVEATLAIDTLLQRIGSGGGIIRIVHGKGLHSPDGRGVLARVAVDALLNGIHSPRVVAFATSPPQLGGTGALLVLLRGARRRLP